MAHIMRVNLKLWPSQRTLVSTKPKWKHWTEPALKRQTNFSTFHIVDGWQLASFANYARRRLVGDLCEAKQWFFEANNSIKLLSRDIVALLFGLQFVHIQFHYLWFAFFFLVGSIQLFRCRRMRSAHWKLQVEIMTPKICKCVEFIHIN